MDLVPRPTGHSDCRLRSWAVPTDEWIALQYGRDRRPSGSRDAKNQSGRGQNLLRGPRQRTCTVADPRLFVDLGDAAGPHRRTLGTSQTFGVGHGRPTPRLLPPPFQSLYATLA